MTEEEKATAYLEAVFGTKEPEEEKVEAALNRAHKIRKFEIDVYVGKSVFFWGFILIFFAVYVFLLTSSPESDDINLTSIVINLALAFLHLTLAIIRGALDAINSGLSLVNQALDAMGLDFSNWVSNVFAYFRSPASDLKSDAIHWALIGLPYFGLMVSLAWLDGEISSRSKQQNWEKHIGFLEDALPPHLHETMIEDPIDVHASGKVHQIFIRLIILFWVGMIVLIILPNFSDNILSSLVLILLIFVIVSIYCRRTEQTMESFIKAMLFINQWPMKSYWRINPETMAVEYKDKDSDKFTMHRRRLPDIINPPSKS